MPSADGLVTTRFPVLVLGIGDQAPELCLGGVAESYPPQCGGVPVIGWSWADQPQSSYEEAGKVRWGEFAVTGRFDGARLALTRAVPSAQGDAPDQVREPEAVPCPEPDGGWRVLDPATTTDEAMHAALDAARYLPGYADARINQTRNPAYGTEDYEAMNDPEFITVVVRVTEDVTGAERTLRARWGGALCVALATYTASELHELKGKVNELPGILSVSDEDQVVDAYVTYDDGSLQEWADSRFGPGVVMVSAALVPVT